MRNIAPSCRRYILLAALSLFPLAPKAALAETISLPLDPKGSSLTFVGDSFLHSFHGEAKDFTGTAQLDSAAMPPVQTATLHFKTAALTTFHNGRDQKMREWLKVTTHPDAAFTLENVKLIEGDIQKADAKHPARFTVSGSLDLNGVKQPIGGTALGWRDQDHLIVTGETTIDTLKHGLPQIREAFMTVGTNVKTTYRFSFTLPAEFALK